MNYIIIIIIIVFFIHAGWPHTHTHASVDTVWDCIMTKPTSEQPVTVRNQLHTFPACPANLPATNSRPVARDPPTCHMTNSPRPIRLHMYSYNLTLFTWAPEKNNAITQRPCHQPEAQDRWLKWCDESLGKKPWPLLHCLLMIMINEVLKRNTEGESWHKCGKFNHSAADFTNQRRGFIF